MIKEAFPPGHFYSVIPDVENEELNWEPKYLGLDYNDENHLNILNELEQLYFTLDNEIDFLQFQTNIIKDSKDLLIESQDIFLVFMPESNTLTNFKI